MAVGSAACNCTTWQNGSDRNIKEHFQPVDPDLILAKVAQLPLSTWNYKTQPDDTHLGPVAQDFRAAFGLNGNDDTHIATVDEGGVALAAVQGLNRKLEAQAAQLRTKDAELQELRRSLVELKAAIAKLTARPEVSRP